VDSSTSAKVYPEMITKETGISITRIETFSVFPPEIYIALSQQEMEINISVLWVSRERGYLQISIQRISTEIYRYTVSVV